MYIVKEYIRLIIKDISGAFTKLFEAIIILLYEFTESMVCKRYGISPDGKNEKNK